METDFDSDDSTGSNVYYQIDADAPTFICTLYTVIIARDLFAYEMVKQTLPRCTLIKYMKTQIQYQADLELRTRAGIIKDDLADLKCVSNGNLTFLKNEFPGPGKYKYPHNMFYLDPSYPLVSGVSVQCSF